MFPFDSPFSVGFIITVAVLAALYVLVLIKLNPSSQGKRITKTAIPKQTSFRKAVHKQSSNPITLEETTRETLDPTKRQNHETPALVDSEKEQTRECAHHFGYLAEHPKNTPLPNNCFSCIKIMECLSADKK